MSSPVEGPLPPKRSGVRKMLLLFALLGIVGVLTMAFSVAIGLVLLVVAESFFVVAFRRFAKASRSAGETR